MVGRSLLRRTVDRLILGGALIAASTAAACGDQSRPQPAQTAALTKAPARAVNLPLPRGTGLALLKTHQANCTANAVGGCDAIEGPVPGSIFYASYKGVYWSLATFAQGERGTADQPEAFKRMANGEWQDLGATGKAICVLPAAVATVWDLDHTPGASNCYEPPSGPKRSPQEKTETTTTRDGSPSREDLHALRDFLNHFVIPNVNTFWRDRMLSEFNVEYVKPLVQGGYSSVQNGPSCNGDPPSIGNAFYCKRSDAKPDEELGFIAWDEPHLLWPAYRRSEAAAAMIIAHEWGHAVQDMRGVLTQGKYSRSLELGADCLAGAWVKNATDNGYFLSTDINGAAKKLFEIGDRSSTPWFAEGAHGQPFERVAAFGAGFRHGVSECDRQ